MGLKDCLKKLGGELGKENRELLESYIEQGMSDDDAVARMELVLDKKIFDVSIRAKRSGAGVKVKRDVLGELRSIGLQRLEVLRVQLRENREESAHLSNLRDEIQWVESNIKHWDHGGAAIDLSDDAQVYMRFEQMGFIHKDAFRRGEFGDGQIKGKNTYELVQSFREMQQRSAEMLSQIHGLLLQEAAILEEIDEIRGGSRGTLDESGDYHMDARPPDAVNEEMWSYSFTSGPTGKPWKISSSGEGDLYISRHGAKAGTPHKERQGPNDFAISFDESVLLPDFAFYLLQYLQPKIAARAHGTAQQAVNKRDIEEVMIEHFQSQAKEDSGTFYSNTGASTDHKVRESTANYKALVKVEEQGTLKTGITKVTGAAEAAHVLAEIRRNAQEGMWAAVLDANDNVVGVVEHTKGTIDGTSVYPSVFAGAILTIPGAAKVWFAHNHPSGILIPSQADERITNTMKKLMDGSGVEIQGHVLMGAGSGNYTEMAPDGVTVTKDQPITPKPRNKKVSIYTRKVRGNATGETIRSPSDSERVLDRMGDPEGVLLLNNRHQVLGFIAMDTDEMESLRHTGGSGRLLKAFSELNAAAFIVSTKDSQPDAANNMASFAAAGDVRMLDAVFKDAGGRSTSMAQLGTLSPSQTFYQSTIGFTSGLLTAVQTMPREKGTVAEMLGSLRKRKKNKKGVVVTTYAPGVTKAEMDWLDLEEWAEAKGGTITRQEMIDYVRANGIVVEEVVHRDQQAYSGQSLEGGTKPRDIFLKMPEIPEDTLIYTLDLDNLNINLGIDDDQADDLMTFVATDQAMAGVVIEREGQGTDVKLTAKNVNEKQYDLLVAEMNALSLTIAKEETTDFKAVDEMQQQLLEKAPGLKENFGFSHFNYKNILAWIRTTERVGPNGERILMVEEIQSDWHQKGRKFGYRDQLDMSLGKERDRLFEVAKESKWALREALNMKHDLLGFDYAWEAVRAVRHNADWAERWNITDPETIEAGNKYREDYKAFSDKAKEAKAALDAHVGAVADAPFKGRGWPKLAMKRIIRMAAEEGFDQIAWITGDQANVRNSVATYVETLTYDPQTETLFAMGKPGIGDRTITMSESEFDEAMGPEVAERLRDEIQQVRDWYEIIWDEEDQMFNVIDGNSEPFFTEAGESIGAPTREQAEQDLWNELNYQDILPTISGDDLGTVGEGVKRFQNFYDREVPNLTKQAASKLDKGAKVELEGQQIYLDEQAPYTHELMRIQQPTMSSMEEGGDLFRGRLPSGSTLGWYVVDNQGRKSAGPFEDESMARGVAGQRNDNQASVHTMKITEQMRDAALEGQTLFQKKKGSITFDQARKGIIKLTQSRDLSTFMHEAGHLYLEILGGLAEQKDAPKQIRDDYQKILEYLGVKNRAEITREHHEHWAESFEKYLQEGKAPSVQLQSAFNAFRRWLTDIWKRMRGASPDDIVLTPEIRDVMDRLLASDEQIAQAKVQQEFTAVFSTAEEMGVSQEVFDAYRESLVKENNDAIERETVRLMAAANRDRMTWWKEERAKVEAKVAEEAYGRRVYQAISLLSKGTKPDGSKLDQGSPFKISKESLVRRFGKDFIKRLPKPWVYSVKGGVDVDVAARQLGYKDGTELVEAMVKAPKMEDWIQYNTDQIMQAQFPDPLLDGSVADEAVKAVHNERRANILAAEMRQLRKLQRRDRKIVSATKKEAKRADREAMLANKGTLPKRVELALIKATAKAKIAAMKVMDVQPHLYLAAERKAGRMAFDAAARKDYQKAYVYKRQQVVNHEMYRAAQRAKDNAEKTHTYLSKFSKKRVQQRLGKLGVLDPILAILEGIELRKVSLKEINRRKALQDLAQQIHDGGIVTPVAEYLYHVETAANGKEVVVVNEAPFQNWQELTIDELEAMKDIIKQLEFQAKKKLEMPVNGTMVVLEDAATDMASNVLEANKIVDIGIGEKTRKQRRKKAVQSGVSHWLGPSVMANVLDGQGWGAVTRHIIVTIRRATVKRLVPMQQKAMQDVSKLYKEHFTNWERTRVLSKKGFAEINGESLSLSDVLSIALNTGNDGNYEALLNGVRVDGKLAYPEAEVQAALGKLTERDWLFVQAVWDYLDSYWPAISKMEKERRGIAPERVEATARVQTTSDGKEVTLRGGYYPLKYNYEHSARGENNVYEDHYGNMGNGVYVSANTRAGATHNRVKNHKMVVQLGLYVIDRHLKEITRDIAIGNEVNFAKNMLNDKGVRNAFQVTGNHAALKELDLWLTDAAVGELPANNELERWMAWARVGFTKSKLAYNVYTAALQLTGYAQSMATIGTEAMAHGIGRVIGNPVKAWKQAFEVSQFLKIRYHKETLSFDKDVTDASSILREYGGGMPTIQREVWEALGRSFFWPIAKMQQLVDLTTWYAGYWKGRNKQGLSDFEAIHYADAQVELAQTSGFFTDRSGIERGTLSATTRQNQFIRLWTTLISYMLRKGNLAYMKTNELKREMSFKNAVLYATDMILLFTMEGIASSMIYGRWDWEEDDPEEILLAAMKESALSIAAGIPFVRELPVAAYGSGNTPIGALSKDLFTLYVQAQQGEMDPALRKAFINSFGTLFHLPASQTNRLLEALIDEDDPEILEYLTGTRD
jgi:DNA repair protein RadC